MSVVTIEDVRLALEKTLLPKGLSHEKIVGLADRLMDLFGFEDQVVDNRLTPSDRDMFYMLEEAGLVTTMQDEVQVQKGKTWRIYYWILKKDQIHRIVGNLKENDQSKAPEANIYESISDDIWKNRQDA